MSTGFVYKDGNMPTEKARPPIFFKLSTAIAWLLLIWTCLPPRLFPASAAELKEEYARYVHRAWTTENGLPQDTVYALAQAGDGCLWIGSEGGLARFDGTAFAIYKKNATPGLASDSITALCPEPDGSLWVGTFGGGLLLLQGGKFTRVEGLAGDRVWSLHRDSRGLLWVVLAGGGIYRLEKGRLPALAVIDDLPGDRVTAVAGSEESTLWIGTSRGLAAIRNGRETVFRARDGLAGDYVYCLFTDSRGSLWVGTTSGLSRIDAAGIRSFTTADGLADDLVRAIGEDALGRLWVGTGRGVTVMDPATRAFSVIAGGLAGETVMAIRRDREDGMWVGTASGGLSYLKRNEVRVFGTSDGLSGPQVRSICEDHAGRLWVGTRDRGLNRLEGGQWRSYSRRDGLASDFITALQADGGGRLWIGTLDAGLQIMEKGKFSPGGPPGGTYDRTVLSLFIDRRENLWVGGDGNGLDRYRDGEWRHYGEAGGLKGSVITAIGEDSQGNLWAGSVRDGLHVLAGGKWRRYTTADGLAGNSVYAIHVDEQGGIWLGTDGGLGLYKRGQFSSFRSGPGPLSGTILAIIEDAGGRLWMSSPAGIFSVKRSELEDTAALGGRDAHCRLFAEMSGLKSTVCAGGFQPAACRSRDGRLWFPTQKGLVVIDPLRLGPPSPPPVPRIERIQVNGITASAGGGGRFPAGSRRFDFRYAAAGFSDPQQVEFSTRLRGFEDDWSQPGRERARSFAGLPPGSYIFQVRARGQGGAWSAVASSAPMAIAPYFHRTAWFYLLLLGAAGASAAGLLLYRRRRVRRLREDRYKSSLLSPGKTAEYVARLEKAMERDKLYLDPGLSLVMLAESTAIPAKHLSQVINEHFGLNFSDFVNCRRVEEAKRLLLDPAAREFKLLRIAYESGFNSKSVFHAAFRKTTGLSPAEFRRLLGDDAGSGEA